MGASKYALFIGRWQPFHKGHHALMSTMLQQGKKLCIAIRDTEVSAFDPLTADERLEMLRKVFPDTDAVKIVVIPDIESVNYGRGVGYAINEIQMPANIEGISATLIRQYIAEGNPAWQARVPEEVAAYIIEKGLLKDE